MPRLLLSWLARSPGAVAGAALADAVFAEPILSPSQHHRGSAPILLSEVVATVGLLAGPAR